MKQQYEHNSLAPRGGGSTVPWQGWVGTTFFYARAERELAMRNRIDSLKRDTRKIKRHVAFTDTHEIKLVFLCTISKKEEQLVAVEEAGDLVAALGNDLLALADGLRAIEAKYRGIGCVGFLIERLGKTIKPFVIMKSQVTKGFSAGSFESEEESEAVFNLIELMACQKAC